MSKLRKKFAETARKFQIAFVRRLSFVASSVLSVVCPPLWRRFFRRPRRTGERFEDFCENFGRPTPNPKDVLGLAGERVAFEYFRADPSCEIVACGVDARFCELDLVFIDRKTREFVVVEVKTRRQENLRYPTINAVDARRRKKLALAGRYFAYELGEAKRRLRFDVVVIIWPLGGEPRIKYYRDYFQYETAIREYRRCNFGRKRPKKTNAKRYR